MITSEQTILNARDVRRARLLNACLNLLPRFRPSGRAIPLMVNAFLKIRQVFPSPADRTEDIHLSHRSVTIGGRQVIMRCLFPKEKPFAAYVHYHGGAWVMMDARSSERLVMPLVRKYGFAVLIPEFHQARDDRVDLAFEDAKAALQAAISLCREQDIRSVMVGGESSGAHLALSAVLNAKTMSQDMPISGFLGLCGAFDIQGAWTLTHAPKNTLVMNAASAKRNLDRLFGKARPGTCLAPLEADLSHMDSVPVCSWRRT